NTRTHLVEQFSQIDDFRFACHIVKRRRSTRERRRHHQVFSAGDSDLREMNVGGTQTPIAGRARDDVSGFEFYLCAKLLEARQMQIDWARTDCAPAWQRDLCFTETCEEWSKREH